MTTKTVTLKDGLGICKLRPLEGEEGFDRARIVDGTFGRPGDILEKPCDLTWEEATEELGPGRTALSPFDLELVLDGVTRHSYLPEGGLETLLRLSDELAVFQEASHDDEAHREALARLTAALTEKPARTESTQLRRRKVDVA